MTFKISPKTGYNCQSLRFCLALFLLLVRISFGREAVEKESSLSQFKMSDDQSRKPLTRTIHSADHTGNTQISESGAIVGPHIRSPLARAVYYKLKEDEQNQNDRHVYVSVKVYIYIFFF